MWMQMNESSDEIESELIPSFSTRAIRWWPFHRHLVRSDWKGYRMFNSISSGLILQVLFTAAVSLSVTASIENNWLKMSQDFFITKWTADEPIASIARTQALRSHYYLCMAWSVSSKWRLCLSVCGDTESYAFILLYKYCRLTTTIVGGQHKRVERNTLNQAPNTLDWCVSESSWFRDEKINF